MDMSTWKEGTNGERRVIEVGKQERVERDKRPERVRRGRKPPLIVN